MESEATSDGVKQPPRLWRVLALGLGAAAVLVVGAVVALNLARSKAPTGTGGSEPANTPEASERAETATTDSVGGEETQPAEAQAGVLEQESVAAAPTFDPTKPYKDTVGPHAIAQSTNITLRDEARAKDLPVRVTLPHGEGPFPVVLFSHGLLGSRDNYRPLASHWASHGYAVIQPTHEDSLKESRTASLDERTGEWRSRAGDMLFLLDQFAVMAASLDVNPGVFDAKRICVAGHSFGAHTSILLAGANIRTGLARREKLTDPRITCAIWLSPQGTGFLLDAEAFGAVTMPVLALTGSEDTSPVQPMLKASDRRRGFELVTGDNNTWLVWVEGLFHGMGGIAAGEDGRDARYQGSGGANETHVRIVKAATTAFLDGHLRDSADAKAWLTGPGLAAMSDGRAKAEPR